MSGSARRLFGPFSVRLNKASFETHAAAQIVYADDTWRETLQHYLEQRGLCDQFAGDLAAGAVVDIGRDPDDTRRNCIVLYVPPRFAHPLPERVIVGGEAVRVVRRERGGALTPMSATS